MSSVAKPGAVQKLVERRQRSGPVAGLLLELAAERRGPGPRSRRVVGSTSSVPAGISSRIRPGRQPVLADERTRSVVVDREDRDGARVADDVALGARAVGPLDRVDPERQVAAAGRSTCESTTPLVEVEVGAPPGPRRRARSCSVMLAGASGGAVAAARVETRDAPDSASNRWSFASGRLSFRTSPGLTWCDESTIATMSWPAAVTWRSSSLPRYSTTSALPGKRHRVGADRRRARGAPAGSRR